MSLGSWCLQPCENESDMVYYGASETAVCELAEKLSPGIVLLRLKAVSENECKTGAGKTSSGTVNNWYPIHICVWLRGEVSAVLFVILHIPTQLSN